MDDFDIEMGDAVDVPMEEPEVADILIGDDLQEDGEIEEPVNGGATDGEAQQLVLNKVHIRGLDLIDQDQLKAYIAAQVGGKGADRIEWVNDTSANLVFSTDSAAQDALLALCAVEIADATQLPPGEVLPAKPVPEKPDIALQVRFALESDRKERGAAQKSRFYLFHPEWDPETDEGRRKRDRQYRDRRDRRDDRRDDRGRYRRGGSGRGLYDEHDEPEPFDVNLYDDDAGALARRARTSPPPRPRQADRGRRYGSRSPSPRAGNDRHRSRNRDKELFPSDRTRDPLRSERGAYERGRSASPTRDDRDAMEADLARDREAVRNNREKARSIKERIYSKGSDGKNNNGPKELFPAGRGTRDLTTGASRAAMDQVPADVLEGMRCLSYDGAVELLDERIPSSSSFSTVRAKRDNMVTPTNADQNTKGTLSIRGTARQSSQGSGILTIKGTAKSVKELFPNKFNDDSSNVSQNVGRELFAEQPGRRRQRAGDLFD
ncbi:hypothetical protein M406DRAFT_100213 [Cryphonectria parasitica EP155]|uniref:Uncharacterized protein n=1 Tax=Cryphonectria parasitica (strain ATCC 38755 / EP155) TaxID=660469 RepID=A0A9P5CJZ9_CRYP1|nr:uncharacterized protein M406DRAFT_100213 [Cryphonectria parasitica EP155]KAF3760235.1 hypothetical protein M406DRAFT_100213 [Cryphonectria parasitica EP155]